MLHPFISSRAFRLGNPYLVGGCIAAHFGLITLALAWPDKPIPANAIARALAEHVTYVVTGPLEQHVDAATTHDAHGRESGGGVVHRPAHDPFAGLAALRLSIPTTIPAPDSLAAADFGAVARHAIAFTDSADGALVEGVLGRDLPLPNANGAYTEAMVDKDVKPYDDNPRPFYPREFMDLGLQAGFDVLFVVDSTGHVDRRSIRFVAPVERLLTRAVRYALERSRYFPAELAGRTSRWPRPDGSSQAGSCRTG